MGIVNVTPDSFSDGGVYPTVDAAVTQALKFVDDGADILDIGGESTRPGATPVTESEELDRVIPVIDALRDRIDIPLSVDTSKPVVMREAVRAGAAMINDVYSLTREGSLSAAVELQVPVCLMHMRGDPGTMQTDPVYDDVVEEVFNFLLVQRKRCIAAGLPASKLVLDPGFGFGKTLVHNLQLLHGLPKLKSLASPIMVGLSRKGMIGLLSGLNASNRDSASAALAAQAVEQGAAIVRVHDVRTTRHVVRMFELVRSSTWKGVAPERISDVTKARF